MKPNELLRIKLLTHSQNLLSAAKKEDWDTYNSLYSSWPALIEQAQKTCPDDLQTLSAQLLSDNAQIEQLVIKSQKKLYQSFEQEVKGLDSVKQYLK